MKKKQNKFGTEGSIDFDLLFESDVYGQGQIIPPSGVYSLKEQVPLGTCT